MRRASNHRGTMLIEALIGSLLLCIGLMALVNTWYFSFRVTVNTDDYAIAYNVGRFAIERIKASGFSGPAEGTSTTYYDGNENVVSQQSAARFTVTTRVVSDLVKSGAWGQSGAVPADNALRTVTVTVAPASGGPALYTTSTYLARAGI